MANTSVYRYIRPIAVLCAMFGTFCAVNTSAQDSMSLQLKYLSFPGAMFCFTVSLGLLHLQSSLRTYVSLDLTSIAIIHLLMGVFHHVFIMSQFLGSKQVIQAIQLTDKLRDTLLHNTYHPKKNVTNPVVFTFITLTILIAGHLSPYVFGLFLHWNDNLSWPELFSIFLSVCFPYRLCSLYSCVYYSCALVVYDTTQVWRYHTKVSSPQTGFLPYFCSLITNQDQLLKEIDELLQTKIFLILAYRVLNVISTVIFHIERDSVVIFKIVFTVLWSVFLGLVFFTMGFASNEYENLKMEVFLYPMKNSFKQESLKIRVLLAQLDNKPGVFTAGRFVIGGPLLLLTFTALAIEYLIMLIQNVEMMRLLVGLNSDVMANIDKQ